MDPVQSAVAALLNALQATQQGGSAQAALPQSLTALLGQDLSLIFQGQAPGGGLQFSLPSGQTVTAQGDFPYPAGTQLLVRVASDAGGVRLQTLQTLPPSPPAILAPLVQGEGSFLQARLTQADPPPELEPLVQLFQLLGGAGPQEAAPQAASQAPLQGAYAQPSGVAQPQAGTSDQPLAGPAAQTPAGQPAQTQAGQPAQTQAGQPAQTQAGQPAQTQAGQPAQTQAGQPAQTQAGQPVQTQAGQPTQTQAGQPVQTQAGQPVQAQAGQPAQTSGAAPSSPPTQDGVRTSTLPAEAPGTPQLGTPSPGSPAPVPQPAGTQGAANPDSLPLPAAPAQAGQTQAPPASAQAPLPPALAPAAQGGSAQDPQDPAALAVKDLTALVQAQPAAAQAQLPSPAALATLVRELPAPVVQALGNLFPRGGAAPDPATVQDVIQRLQTSMARTPDLPAGQGEALVQLIRNLVRAPDATGHTAPGSVPQAPSQQGAPSPAAAPEAWQTWLKEGLKALSDPAVSPREAPFHAAQAKEGTALYELPLPWAPGSSMQVWVENDRQGKGKGGKEGGRTRVLLGLNFSRLGEVRLGLSKGSEGLQVRVWAQHPEALMSAQASMEEELKTLDLPVDLKILPLAPSAGGVIPSIRSLAVGSTFQVLG